MKPTLLTLVGFNKLSGYGPFHLDPFLAQVVLLIFLETRIYGVGRLIGYVPEASQRVQLHLADWAIGLKIAFELLVCAGYWHAPDKDFVRYEAT